MKFQRNPEIVDEIVNAIALRLQEFTTSLLIVTDYQNGELGLQCKKLYLTDLDIEEGVEVPRQPTHRDEQFLLVCPVPEEMPEPYIFMLIVNCGDLKITSGHPYTRKQMSSGVDLATTYLINNERVTKPRSPARLSIVKKES